MFLQFRVRLNSPILPNDLSYAKYVLVLLNELFEFQADLNRQNWNDFREIERQN